MKATFKTQTGTFEMEGTPSEIALFAKAMADQVAPQGAPQPAVASKKRVRYDHSRSRTRKYSDQDRSERLFAFLTVILRHIGPVLSGPEIATQAKLGSAMALGQVKKDLVKLAETMRCPVHEIVSITETLPRRYRPGPRLQEALSHLAQSNPQQLAVVI